MSNPTNGTILSLKQIENALMIFVFVDCLDVVVALRKWQILPWYLILDNWYYYAWFNQKMNDHKQGVNIIFYLPNEKFTSQNSFSQKAMYFYLKNKNINICARKIHTNKMLVLLWFRRLFVIIIKLSRTVYFASIFLPVKVTGRLFFLPVRFEMYPWFVG